MLVQYSLLCVSCPTSHLPQLAFPFCALQLHALLPSAQCSGYLGLTSLLTTLISAFNKVCDSTVGPPWFLMGSLKLFSEAKVQPWNLPWDKDASKIEELHFQK